MLLIVKDNVEVAPLIIGDAKDLVIVGAGTGIEQPVNKLLSRNKSAPTLSLFAPEAVIFTHTVLFCGMLIED